MICSSIFFFFHIITVFEDIPVAGTGSKIVSSILIPVFFSLLLPDLSTHQWEAIIFPRGELRLLEQEFKEKETIYSIIAFDSQIRILRFKGETPRGTEQNVYNFSRGKSQPNASSSPWQHQEAKPTPGSHLSHSCDLSILSLAEKLQPPLTDVCILTIGLSTKDHFLSPSLPWDFDKLPSELPQMGTHFYNILKFYIAMCNRKAKVTVA